MKSTKLQSFNVISLFCMWSSSIRTDIWLNYHFLNDRFHQDRTSLICKVNLKKDLEYFSTSWLLIRLLRSSAYRHTKGIERARSQLSFLHSPSRSHTHRRLFTCLGLRLSHRVKVLFEPLVHSKAAENDAICVEIYGITAICTVDTNSRHLPIVNTFL